MSKENQIQMLHEQIDDILKGIKEAKENDGENFTIKQLEKSRRILENKLEKLNTQDRKDDVVTFESLKSLVAKTLMASISNSSKIKV